MLFTVTPPRLRHQLSSSVSMDTTSRTFSRRRLRPTRFKVTVVPIRLADADGPLPGRPDRAGEPGGTPTAREPTTPGGPLRGGSPLQEARCPRLPRDEDSSPAASTPRC